MHSGHWVAKMHTETYIPVLRTIIVFDKVRHEQLIETPVNNIRTDLRDTRIMSSPFYGKRTAICIEDNI